MKIRYLPPIVLFICGCNLISSGPPKNTFPSEDSRDAGQDVVKHSDFGSFVDQNDGGIIDPVDVYKDKRDMTTQDMVADKGTDTADVAPDVPVDMGITSCQESEALGPVAYWSFDNSDDGISFPNLMEGSTPATLSPSVQIVEGIHGDGVQLNGVDGSIVAPHHTNFEVSEGTISLWFEKTGTVVCTDTKTGCAMFSKDAYGQGVGGHFTVALTENNAVLVRLQSVNITNTVQSPPVDLTKPHHIAVSFGAAGMALYVDGQLARTNSYTGGLFNSDVPPVGNTESVAIGWSMWNVADGTVEPKRGFFDGTIDEVMFFDRQLSVTEIGSLADGCSD